MYGVRAVGDRAYLFDWGEGLIVVDISDPDHPVRLGSYHSPASLRNMVKQGDLLYISDSWIGFTVLNVADPSKPRVVGIYRTPTGPDTQGSAGLALRDGLVYHAAGYGGVDIVDVSDPALPVRVGNVPALPPGTAVHGIELDGQVLRATAFVPGLCEGGGPGLLLRNYSVSNPVAPVYLGQSPIIGCSDAAKIQTRNGITRIRTGIGGGDAGGSSPVGGRLATLNCVNPAAPTLLSVSINFAPVADFTLAGDLMYVCEDLDTTNGDDRALAIRDAASPASPMLGLFNASTTGTDGHFAVAAQDGHVYTLSALSLLDGSVQVCGLHLFQPTINPPGLRLAASLGPERVANQSNVELIAAGRWVYATYGDGERLANALNGRSYIANGLVIVEHITPPPPPCPGDANGDSLVNAADLSVLLGSFGGSVPPGTGADFNGDGVVNAADLSVLLGRFGSSCP